MDFHEKRRKLTVLITAMLPLFVLTTCDDLFKAGLGDKVDIDPPTVAIVSHANGQYVGGTLTIGGTYGDDSEVALFQISLDGGATYNTVEFDPGSTQWEYSIDTTRYADGETDIRVRVEDGSGKSADKKLLLYFDNRAPVVLIKNPQGYEDQQYNDDITIRGEATDSSGIVNVNIKPFDEAGEPVALYDSEGNPTDSYSVEADGTNSWSFLFQSRYYTLAGIYKFVITATDKAGLSNSYAYHYDDILELAGKTVTVENLYKIEHGQSVSGLSFSGTDLPPLRLDGLVLDIDQSLDIPQFDFSTPSAENNSLGENAVAVGTVIDDDGVDTGTIEVRIDSSDDADWVPVTTVKGSGLSVSWEYDLAALDEGSHTIQVRATDTHGVSNESGIVDFVIDSGVPEVSISTPASGDYISETFQLAGTTADSVGIDVVEVSVNNGPYESVTTFDSGVFTEIDGAKTYDWSHDVIVETDGSTDGSYTFRTRTTDLSGKSAADSIQIYVDTVPPEISFLSPVTGSTVNGTVRVQGTTQNTSPLTSITLAVEDAVGTTETYTLDDTTNEFDPGPTGNPSTKYGWYKDIDTTGFADGALTLTLTADDLAEKTNSEVLSLTVNQATDLPVVIFDNMDENGSATDNAFAGSPALIGRITDDDGVDVASIEVRIDSSDEADWTAVGSTTGSGLSVSWEQSISGLAEGEHSIEVRAKDIFGNDTFSSIYGIEIPDVPFILDLGAPEVTVTSISDLSGPVSSPFQGKYLDGDFTISGTADDGIGVQTVSYRLNEGSYNDLTLTLVSGNEMSFSFSIDVSAESLIDGPLDIRVQSEDYSGKTAFTDVQLILDTTAPEVEVLLPTNPSTVNGLVEIKGTASDANQVAEVYLWTDAASASAPGDAAAGDFSGWTLLPDKYSWSYEYNSRGNNGAWQAQLAAVDAAGNISPVSTRLFTLDQSTDIPMVSYTNVTAGDPAVDNLLTSSDVISGAVTDDDAVDPATVEYSTNGADWLPADGSIFTVSGTGQTVSFTYDLTAAGLAEQQAAYALYVRADDTDPDSLGPISSAETQVDFAVDDSDPTLTLETYAAGLVNVTGAANIPGSYFSTSGGFALAVSASDGVSVSGVTVRVNGQTNSATYNGGSGLYEFNTDDVADLLTSPAMPEGQTIVRVTVTDYFGKTTSEDVQLFVDDTAPSASYIQPISGAAVNGQYVIQGTGSDNKKLSKLDLSIGGMDTYTIDTEAGTNEFDGGSTAYRWDLTVDTESIDNATYGARPTADYTPVDLTALAAVSGMNTGEYALVGGTDWYRYNSAQWVAADPWEVELQVIGTDAAGNESAPGVVSFIADQAADYPVIRLTNRSLNTTAGLYVFTGDTVEGTITDDDGVDPASLEISFNSGVDWEPASDPEWTVTGSGTSVSFSYDISGVVAEGDQTVLVRGADLASAKAGGYAAVSRTTDEYAFTVDRNPPAITVTGLASGLTSVASNFQGNYFNGDITITGTTDDGPKDALSSVEVDYTFTGAWDGYEAVTQDPDLLSWNFTTNFGVSSGPVDIRIRAVDEFGKTTVYELEEVIDITPPTVAFLTPGAGEDDVNGLVTFSGTASDANQVTEVYYWTGSTGAADPNDPTDGDFTDWTGPLPDTYSWSDDYNSRGNNGGWRVWAFAVDIAGNISTPVERTFTLDQSADIPVVAYTNVTAGDPAGDNLLTSADIISGTITDDDAVDPATVEYSTNGADWLPADGSIFTVSGTGQTVSFTYDLTAAGLGEQQAGYELYVRGDDTDPDSLGPISSAETQVDFAVDDSDPTLAYLTYDAGRISVATPSSIPGSYFYDAFVLTGSAHDGVAVNNVTVEINGVVNDADITGSGTDITWEFDSSTATSDPQLLTLSEGETYATIIVEDVFGKTTSRQLQLFSDQSESTVTITDPVPAADDALVTSTYTMVGTADDGPGSGIDTIYYWIEDPADGGTDDPPALISGWNVASGSSSWSITADLAVKGDGYWRLHVKAVDAMDIGMAAAETADFYIDLTAPVVGITGPANNAVYMETFTFSGTVTETNPLNEADVQAYINGTPTTTTGTTPWSATIALADLNAGENTLSIEVTDIGGRTTTTERTVYRDEDEPVIEFSNLESDGSTVFQESDPKVVGTITDATGVQTAESYLEQWDYSAGDWIVAPVEGWTSLGTPNGTTIFNFNKKIGPTGLDLADGRYRITVDTADGALNTPNDTSRTPGAAGESQEFIIDRENPDLVVTAPTIGSFQNGDFAVSGTAGDENSITSIKVKIDSNDFASGATEAITSDGYATWSVASLSTTGLSQTAHTLYIQATDASGRTTLLTRDFTFDTQPPEITIIEPISTAPNYTKVNGTITIKGTTSDLNAVEKVEIKFGDSDDIPANWIEQDNEYNWQEDENIETYATPDFATDLGGNLWQLNVYVRAYDAAGNIANLTDYILIVDPDGDSPLVTIYQPLDNSTVGGSTRVYGTATDDDSVFSVQMSIDVNGDGDYDDEIDYWDYDGVTPPTQPLAGDGDTDDLFEKEATWYDINGTTNWYQVINQYGEYNAAVQGETRTINVRVRAVDTKNGSTAGAYGNPEEITITFDNTVPIIEDVEIDLDAVDDGVNETPYSTGIKVSGTYYLRMIVKDESGLDLIERIEEGPLSGTSEIQDGVAGATVTYDGNVGGYEQYTVMLEIDTLDMGVSGDLYDDTSGQYSISIKATDNSTPNPFVTYSYVTVQVDNFYPSSDPLAGDGNMVGDQYKIQSTATDVGVGSGTVQGVEKIVTYIVKSGEVYDLSFDETSVTLSDGTYSDPVYVKNEANGGVLENVDVPNDTDGAPYRIIIDKLTEVGVTDSPPNGDGDGYLESLTLNGNDYDWWAEINSYNLPDGPIDVHYIVYDNAGNATHYVESLFVKNNGPDIASIDLSTDLNGDGDVTDPGETENFTVGYAATNFTARNNRLKLAIDVNNGNGELYYSVEYSGTEQANLIDSGGFVAGDLYRIFLPGDTDFTAIGAADSNQWTFFEADGAGTGTGNAFLVGDTVVNAGSFTIGDLYYIRTTGTTDFTVIGAADNNPGTIFTATGIGAGTGDAFKVDTLPGESAGVFELLISEFGGIPDSTEPISGNPNQRTFNIAVWDSTDGTTPFVDSLSDTEDVSLNLDNLDETPPNVTMNALYWNNETDNSVYNNDPTEGHLDLSTLTGATGELDDSDPRISGRIRFEGTVDDNQRIQYIQMRIYDTNVVAPTTNVTSFDFGSGSGAWHTVAQWDGDNVQGTGDLSTDGWIFTTLNENLGKDIHELNWTLVWDSTELDFMAGTNIAVEIRAQDFRNPGVLGDPNLSTTASQQVDVVPYITSIDRDADWGGTNRSKYGRFPVQQGETAILVSGFNLFNGTTQDGDNWIDIYTAETGGTAGAGLTIQPENLPDITAPDKRSFYLSLNAGSLSGWLRLSVEGVEAINGANDDSLTYNKEDDGSGISSTLWNDDRYLRVWRTGDYFQDSTDAKHPSMSMRASNGRLYGLWSNYATSAAYISGPQSETGNAWADRDTLFSTYDPPEWTDIYVEQGANTAHSVILENFYGGTTTTAWGFLASRINTGNRVELDDMGNEDVDEGDFDGPPDHVDGYDEMLYQFQNPRIAVIDSTNTQYIAYYDSWAKAIKYSRADNGSATFTTSGGHMTDSATVVDGVDDFDDAPEDSTPDMSPWLDIALDPASIPVIVYYDMTNENLKIAHGDDATPNGTGEWTKSNVVADTSSVKYLTMKINSTNGDMHIAYYKVSTGDLMYVFGDDANDAAPWSWTFETPTIIDSEGAVGAWADLALDSGNPYISYLNSTAIGTYSGLKHAYYTGSGNVWDADNWEHEVIPAATAVYDMRSSIEVNFDQWFGGSADIAIGYGSDRFDLIYLIGE